MKLFFAHIAIWLLARFIQLVATLWLLMGMKRMNRVMWRITNLYGSLAVWSFEETVRQVNDRIDYLMEGKDL